jgi:hypothetical protein
MERVLDSHLPYSFPLSMWMINHNSGKGGRQELILPYDPLEEASYWLGFGDVSSFQLRDSVLARITNCPQSFMGVTGHPKIEIIMRKLRKAYDGKKITRVENALNIPQSDFYGPRTSFSLPPEEVKVSVVKPEDGIDIASDFEKILSSCGAIDYLIKKGYDDISSRVSAEQLTANTFT